MFLRKKLFENIEKRCSNNVNSVFANNFWPEKHNKVQNGGIEMAC